MKSLCPKQIIIFSFTQSNILHLKQSKLKTQRGDQYLFFLTKKNILNFISYFAAVGCQAKVLTLFWCPHNSTTGSLKVLNNPNSGIIQTFAVVSSEQLAITWSLNGDHWTSKQAALWASTNGVSLSIRPAFFKKIKIIFKLRVIIK